MLPHAHLVDEEVLAARRRRNEAEPAAPLGSAYVKRAIMLISGPGVPKFLHCWGPYPLVASNHCLRHDAFCCWDVANWVRCVWKVDPCGGSRGRDPSKSRVSVPRRRLPLTCGDCRLPGPEQLRNYLKPATKHLHYTPLRGRSWHMSFDTAPSAMLYVPKNAAPMRMLN